MWILTHVGLMLGFLFAVVLIAHVLTQKRPPSGTIAWLLAILLIPYIGVPLYLLLGGRKTRKIAERKGKLDIKPLGLPLPDNTPFTDRLLQTYNVPPASAGNTVEFCTTGVLTWKKLIGMIEQARHCIFISTFLFHTDSVGREILGLLTKKAASGVNVRLLMDGVGSLHTRHRFLAPLLEAGGRYAFFIPVLHRPFRGRTNLRNHRKTVITDYSTVLAGGTNIGSEYIGPQPDPGRWQDLSFALNGPAVEHYLRIFLYDWEFASGEHLEIPADRPVRQFDHTGSAVVQVVPSGPDVPNDPLYDAILSILFAAKSRVWIVTPYFIPDDALSKAIRLAVRRGVDVRIVMPRKSNHFVADIVREVYLREIQSVGANILLYNKGMIHAKALLMDDTLALVGSANIDIRSLLLNYEATLMMYSPCQIEWISRWILSLVPDCIPRPIGESFARNLFENTVRLLSPLL
jgi:cardiolipin synthase